MFDLIPRWRFPHPAHPLLSQLTGPQARLASALGVSALRPILMTGVSPRTSQSYQTCSAARSTRRIDAS